MITLTYLLFGQLKGRNDYFFTVRQLVYSPVKGFLRKSFFVDLFFLALSRLSLEPLVARVGILFFRFLFNASSFFRSRENAICLLRY